MKITIESTEMFTKIGGQMARVWRGVTEDGIPCDLAVARLRVVAVADQTRFEAELKELPAPEPPRYVDFQKVW